MANSERRVRVYVSSTYLDLREGRGEIRTALQRMAVEDVAMETYTAGEERPLQRCLDDVRSCDLYVGIFAWRYGFIPEGETRSITELEYLAAGEARIPRLIFLLTEDAPWPPTMMDRGDTASLIEELRRRLGTDHVCDMFSTVKELRSTVAEAVSRRLRDHGTGFPGDDTDREWSAYHQRLVSEYRRLDLDALTPPERDEHLQINLREVFVEPNLREDMPPTELPRELARQLHEAAKLPSADLPDGIDDQLLERTRESYRKRPARTAFEVISAPGSRALVLLGDPGAGKSTLMRYLALALAEGRPTGHLEVLREFRPILIELRDFAINMSRYETFADYLAYRARTDGLGVPAPTFTSQLRRGGATLVIFDGLDEVFELRTREAISRQIAGFAAAHPEARVLVTSRIIGYRDRTLRDAGFAHHTIQELEREQTDTFLRTWYSRALEGRPTQADHRRTRLVNAIRESAPIRELAGNPLLLTILAIIGKHQELPRERWKVYNHAASVLVQHWDVNKHLTDERIDASVIGEDDKKDLLRRIAYRMQAGSHGVAGVHLVEGDLVADIREYLQERFQYSLEHAAKIANAMMLQLRERNFILARYGPGVYGFVHRGLLEFFAASEIVRRFEKARTLDEVELRVSIFGEHWEDPTWHEVLRLITGMVDAAVAGRIIAHLLASATPSRSSALDRPPLASVTLAAQCLAEVRNLNVAAQPARRILEAVIELLRLPARSFGTDDREKRIESLVLPALAGVGAGWPGREVFRDHFVTVGRYAIGTPGARLNARIAAALYPGSTAVRDLLRNLVTCAARFEQRKAALLGLCASWKDDAATHPLVLRATRDPDDEMRCAAIEMLTTHWAKDESTLHILIGCRTDHDHDVRRLVVDSLARHWPQHARTRSIIRDSLLHDQAIRVRVAAVSALTILPAPGADTDVSDLLAATTDPVDEVRKAALQALVSRHQQHPATLPAVQQALQDSHNTVRKAALERLAGQWTEHSSTLGLVLSANRDVSREVRLQALTILQSRWTENSAARAVLDQAADDMDEEIRVASVLRSSGPGNIAEAEAAVAALVIDQSSDDVRAEAVRWLGTRRAAAPSGTLRRALRDPASSVRGAALTALTEPNGDSVPNLEELLVLCTDPDVELRERALAVLAERHGRQPAAVSLLLRESRSTRWQHRRIAIEGLAASWPDEHATREVVRRALHDPAGINRHIAHSIEAASARTRPVADGTLEPGPLVESTSLLRWHAAERWADQRIGIEATVAEIKAATEHRLPALRAIALTMLALRHPDDPETPRILQRAMTDPDPDVRNDALLALLAGRSSWPAAFAAAVQAARDEAAQVRSDGLNALLRCWPQAPETRACVARALYDSDSDILSTALQVALLRAPDEPSTYAAYLAAVTHEDPGIRWSALSVFGCRWAERPETLSSLIAARQVPMTEVRRVIQQFLCTRWPDDPRVREGTFDGAGTPDDALRYDSIRLCLLLWPEDRRSGDLLSRAATDVGRWIRETTWSPVADAGQLTLTSALVESRHPDGYRRYLALSHLFRHEPDSPRTTAVLRRALGDTDDRVRTLAARALGARRDSAGTWETVSRLTEHMHDGVRATAVRLISVLRPGRQDSRAVLARAMRDPAAGVRQGALRALLEQWPDDPNTVARIRAALDDLSPDIRTAAVEAAVSTAAMAEHLVGVLERASGDPASAVRREAIRAMVWTLTGHPIWHRRLVAALHDPDWPTRQLAREALIRAGEWADPDADCIVANCDDWTHRSDQVARLAYEPTDVFAFADDPEASVRNTVVREAAVREGADERTLQILMAGLSEPDPSRRSWSLHWIARAYPGSPALHSALEIVRDDDDPTVLYSAGTILASLIGRADFRNEYVCRIHERRPAQRWQTGPMMIHGAPDDPRTAQAIRTGLCSGTGGLRQMSYDVLSMRWGLDRFHFDDLNRIAARGNTYAAVALCRQWPDVSAAFPMLLRLSSHPSHAVRAAALESLGSYWFRQPGVHDLLRSAAQDDCPGVRIIGYQALCLHWPSDAVTTGLLSEALRDPDDRVREAMCEPHVLAATYDGLRDSARMIARETDRGCASYLFDAVAIRAMGADDHRPYLQIIAEHPERLWPTERNWLSWALADSTG